MIVVGVCGHIIESSFYFLGRLMWGIGRTNSSNNDRAARQKASEALEPAHAEEIKR